MQEYIKNQILETRRIMDAMAADSRIQETLERAARICIQSLQAGGRILLAGNGGSAADAQHIAG